MDDKKIGDAKCDVPFVQVGCAVKDKEVYPQYIQWPDCTTTTLKKTTTRQNPHCYEHEHGSNPSAAKTEAACSPNHGNPRVVRYAK